MGVQLHHGGPPTDSSDAAFDLLGQTWHSDVVVPAVANPMPCSLAQLGVVHLFHLRAQVHFMIRLSGMHPRALDLLINEFIFPAG